MRKRGRSERWKKEGERGGKEKKGGVGRVGGMGERGREGGRGMEGEGREGWESSFGSREHNKLRQEVIQSETHTTHTH